YLGAVRQLHVAMLTDRRRHDLHAGAPCNPESGPERCHEHCGRSRSPVPCPPPLCTRRRFQHERAGVLPHGCGEVLIRLPLSQPVEHTPGAAQFLERAPMPGVLPEPCLELVTLAGSEAAGIEAPGPNGGLVLDLGARLQSDDLAHLDSPSLTRRRNGSSESTSNPSRRPRLRNRSRQRTSPLATCFSIVLCESPSTAAISAC